MMKVPLAVLSNQSLSFNADNNFWELHFYQAISNLYVDISIDGVSLPSALRCVAGDLLIPYDYLWNPKYGNLIFNSEPDWEKFGDTCELIYLNNEEANSWKGLFNGNSIV